MSTIVKIIDSTCSVLRPSCLQILHCRFYSVTLINSTIHPVFISLDFCHKFVYTTKNPQQTKLQSFSLMELEVFNTKHMVHQPQTKKAQFYNQKLPSV